MKLFLTGASGLLGSNVARVAARRGHQVTAVVGGWRGPIPDAAHVLRLDLADEPTLQQAVLDLFPDAIINCAATSSPAQVDAHPEHARQLNVALPAALAKLAHHLSARLVHISSEQVFDGTQPTPYRRDDPVNPPNLYARQKIESEHLVAEFAPENTATVRLPLLGGNSLTGQRSLHERFFAEWAAGRACRLFRDEIRQPCSAENAAEVLVELIERNDLTGVYHWAGAESLTRVEIGRRVAAHFKITGENLITEAARGDAPASAGRQEYLRLDCAPLTGRLRTKLEFFDALLNKLVVPPPFRSWYANGFGAANPC
jgi:dTDP-4-dehydrorhamnose reductase